MRNGRASERRREIMITEREYQDEYDEQGQPVATIYGDDPKSPDSWRAEYEDA
jgi:hypothetical protein